VNVILYIYLFIYLYIYKYITLSICVEATYNTNLCAVRLILCCYYVTLVSGVLVQVPHFHDTYDLKKRSLCLFVTKSRGCIFQLPIKVAMLLLV